MKPPHPQELTSLELGLLARSANCLFYGAILESGGQVTVEWAQGVPGTVDAFPVRDLLEERLDSAQRGKVRRHLDRLRAKKSSELQLTYISADGQAVAVRDVANVVTEIDGSATILGSVSALPAPPAHDGNGPMGWLDEIVEGIDQAIAYWTDDRQLFYTNSDFRALFGSLADGSLDTFLWNVAHSSKLALGATPEEWVSTTFQNIDAQMSSTWSWQADRSYLVRWRTLQHGIMMLMQDTTNTISSERALLKARDLAEESNANKSRFLRAANHDLRQPLATLKILMFSAIESKGLVDYSDLFRAMEVAVSVMEDILESLLQIGQLDANGVTVQKQHFQAAHLLERLRVQFEPQARKKKIQFRVVNSVVTLESDRLLLERILSNLIANAIKFTKTGGVLLGLRRKGRHVEIQVVDTGVGVPDDQLEFIFREFYQGDIDTADRRRGLGLGLNIASRLAELLNHSLQVRSSVTSGTIFSVTVPIGNVWRSKVEQFDIDERIAGEFVGVKVIFVEDDTNLRNAISVMLTRWGVNALSAKDGKEALARMAQEDFKPDLAIVDYRLSNGTLGTDAIASIRATLQNEIPGIVCTAEIERSLIAGIRETGLPVLTKPVSPARLRSVMHHLLYEREKLS